MHALINLAAFSTVVVANTVEQCETVAPNDFTASFSKGGAYYSDKRKHSFAADLVFDGVGRDGTKGKKGYNFAMAKNNKGALKVNIPDMLDITYVDIYPRTDKSKFLKRYTGLEVMVEGQPCSHSQCPNFKSDCLQTLVDNSEPIRFACGFPGQSIVVKNDDSMQLQIAELDILTCEDVEQSEGCCQKFELIQSDVTVIKEEIQHFQSVTAPTSEDENLISDEEQEILDDQADILEESVVDLGGKFDTFSDKFFPQVEMVENLAINAFGSNEKGPEELAVEELGNKLFVLEANLDDKLGALATLDLDSLEDNMKGLKHALDTNVQMDNQRVQSTNLKIADYDQKFQGMVASLYRRFGQQMEKYRSNLDTTIETENMELDLVLSNLEEDVEEQLRSMGAKMRDLEKDMYECSCLEFKVDNPNNGTEVDGVNGDSGGDGGDGGDVNEGEPEDDHGEDADNS